MKLLQRYTIKLIAAFLLSSTISSQSTSEIPDIPETGTPATLPAPVDDPFAFDFGDNQPSSLTTTNDQGDNDNTLDNIDYNDSKCCNIPQGQSCPSTNLVASMGITTTTANGAILTSCCPAGYNNDMSVNLGGTPLNPNCNDVNESTTTGIESVSPTSGGGSGSSGMGGVFPECSTDVMAQYPTCNTCIYSCNQGGAKQCSFGQAGSCSINCVDFEGVGVQKEEVCMVTQARSGSADDMSGMMDDSMNSSTEKDYCVSIVLSVVWAIGYGIVNY